MDAIAQIRRFNRTVTQQIGVLEEHFLGRDRSLGASRLLFEIGANGMEVRQLRARLNLDSGYTSRLLRGLESEGLIRTAPPSWHAAVSGGSSRCSPRASRPASYPGSVFLLLPRTSRRPRVFSSWPR